MLTFTQSLNVLSQVCCLKLITEHRSCSDLPPYGKDCSWAEEVRRAICPVTILIQFLRSGHPGLWIHKDNGILARITGLSVLKVDVGIEPKDQVSINSPHRKPAQFTAHESLLLCETITEAVSLHFTWNKLSVHLDPIGRAIIKPGSTVSEVLLASHKSRVY